MKRSSVLVCVWLSLLFAASIARADSYTYSTLDVPGAVFTEAYGINDSGQVVGDYNNGYTQLAYSWDGTSFSVIGGPAVATGVSNTGQIVGQYLAGVNTSLGFSYSGGNFSTFSYPGGVYGSTAAGGVNSSGTIVGEYVDPNTGSFSGFVYSGGSYSTINPPGSYSTTATSITDNGLIAGYYTDATGKHGFELNGSVFSQIDVPNAIWTAAWGINSAGDVSGLYYDGLYHGFLYDGQTFTTLNVPGAANTYAYSINSNGTIVGEWDDGTGLGRHGFIATAPVPEPETYAMLLAGLALLGFVGRRQKPCFPFLGQATTISAGLSFS